MTAPIDQRFSIRGALCILVFIAALTGLGLIREDVKEFVLGRGRVQIDQVHVEKDNGGGGYDVALPDILIEAGLYNNGSFANEAGVTPAYWGAGQDNKTNPERHPTYGPCYTYEEAPDWEAAISRYNRTRLPLYNKLHITKKNSMDVFGFFWSSKKWCGCGSSFTV